MYSTLIQLDLDQCNDPPIIWKAIGENISLTWLNVRFSGADWRRKSVFNEEISRNTTLTYLSVRQNISVESMSQISHLLSKYRDSIPSFFEFSFSILYLCAKWRGQYMIEHARLKSEFKK